MKTADEAMQAASAARAAGALEQSLQAAVQALRLSPGRADAWFFAGSAALELERYSEAEHRLQRAQALAPPDHPVQDSILASRAQALARLGRWAEAAMVADQCAARAPGHPWVLGTLGTVYSQIGLIERALGPCEAAVAAAPQDPGFHFNLSGVLRFLGRADEAIAACERALALAPDRADVHHALSGLKTWTARTAHLERLSAAVARASGRPADLALLQYALFKELDDLGETAEAAVQLEAAARNAATGRPWRRDADAAQAQALIRAYPASGFGPPPTVSTATAAGQPIFIVGLPRSGTTLVERALAAHSQVQAMGELQTFGLIIKAAAATPGPDLLDPATIAASVPLDWPAVGEAYLRETAFLRSQPAAGAAPVRGIDKLPQNHLLVGLIRKAFPNAAIIHVRRAPMDSLFGAHRLLFGSAHDWSYGLDDLAAHYQQYRILMDHWRSCLGEGLIDLSHEAMIADPDAEIRRLLDACGLPFEAACLSPHLAGGSVTTASALQVRRPIHAGGLGAWRRYADYLEPLRAKLQGLGYVDAAGEPLGAGWT